MARPTNERLIARIKNSMLVKRWMIIPFLIAMGMYILTGKQILGMAAILGLLLITGVNQNQRIDELRLEIREDKPGE